ncbi:MAG: ribosome biogenesis GTPase Der [Deltaproteobacteria bacterium]|uniref:ribosome biogenesis GTPase Der n=1 Tax=Hydrosulfovibrio ferrireducens TaxID=2934181 RepID=UPI001200C512|nr:MAG: ribosome biogenesis GTPase Der [Deltaproteobacteria bacterium]
MQTRYPIVALVGRPNVGKSSLFNRFAKSRKAIVDPTPGVTRDRHYEQVTMEERTFILVDTGGIEGDGREMMAGLIREQTMQAMREADVILFLLDGKEGVLPEDYEVADYLRRTEKPVHFLVNKVDSPELEQKLIPQFYELGVDRLWPVSAAHGYGVKPFFEALLETLPVFPESEDIPPETISLACLGRPNVGKSSLINRLLGEERMVVSDIPGTTRDSVDTLLTVGKQPYLLIDTAGIRRKGKVQEKLEKFSVLQALGALERCDIVLILIDAGEGITEQDTKVLGYAFERGRACMIVVNKWDLLHGDAKRQKQLMEEIARATSFVEYAPVLKISALTGAGVKQLLPTVAKIYKQYCGSFSTGKINRILQDALEGHNPPMHKGRRLKLYYTTQISTKPPTFIVFANYPKGVHFSYLRYLLNQFRAGLKLDAIPIKIILKERQRKEYG